MRAAEPVFAPWRAELALGFERREGRTVLAGRRHAGPLVVQKPFYPEGEEVCHAIVVHPPGGIAGGDELELHAHLDGRSHALLTTPGATKWYCSAGTRATQSVRFEVHGALEWLPQETIVFDGALAQTQCRVELAAGARYVGWEVLCLGRSGSGERFGRGRVRIATEIHREGKPLWLERGTIEGGGKLMTSPAGLAGHTVCGTLICCAQDLNASIVSDCRRIPGIASTLLPGVLVARYLGDSSEEAKRAFVRLWSILRPAVLGREAVEPRIWRT